MIPLQRLAVAVGLLSVTLPGCRQAPAAEAPPDPLADAAQNIRLAGHNDLQRRESLLAAVRSDAANGN